MLLPVLQFLKTFRASKPITATSTLGEVERAFPGFCAYILRRYGCTAEPHLALSRFCERNNFPSPWIVLAEFQVSGRVGRVTYISASKLRDSLDQFEVLDVRESWELGHGSLPGATRLTRALLRTMITHWPREMPIVIYCHFGVRSLDAAAMLVDQGFCDVRVLEGGIDAWAAVDPTVRRYEQAWC